MAEPISPIGGGGGVVGDHPVRLQPVSHEQTHQERIGKGTSRPGMGVGGGGGVSLTPKHNYRYRQAVTPLKHLTQHAARSQLTALRKPATHRQRAANQNTVSINSAFTHNWDYQHTGWGWEDTLSQSERRFYQTPLSHAPDTGPTTRGGDSGRQSTEADTHQ